MNSAEKKNSFELGRDICEGYRPSARRYKDNEKTVAVLKEKIDSVQDPTGKLLLQSCIDKKNAEMSEDHLRMTLFEAGIMYLEEEERHVIEQMYKQGLAWREITYVDGRKISTSSIEKVRNKALTFIGEIIKEVEYCVSQDNAVQ